MAITMSKAKPLKKQIAKKSQLVNASLELFLKRGFHPTRIEDIIARAKVGKGTFYLYFKNKEDVVEYMADQFIQEIMETMNWVQENIHQGTSLAPLFHEESIRLAKTFEQNQKVARFFFREGRAVGKSINQKIQHFYNQLTDMSELTFILATKAGLLQGVHPKIAAVAIMGGIIQMYERWVEGNLDMPLIDIIQQTLGFFEKGLGMNMNTLTKNAGTKP